MIPLGFEAPGFSLPDTLTGKEMSLSELKSNKGTLIMFICNHCPYVKHVIDQLVELGNDYMPRGISMAAISCSPVS